MKKIIVIIITLCLCLSVTSCKIKSTDEEIAQAHRQEHPVASEQQGEEIIVETVTDEQTQVPADEEKEEKQSEEITESEDSAEQTEKPPTEQPKSDKTYNKDWEGDINYGPTVSVEPQTFHILVQDVFVAEVLEKTVLESCEDFASVGTSNSVVEICTVKITDALRTVYSEKETTVRVARLTNGEKCEPFDVGKRYLMSVLLQPYDRKPIFVDAGFLSAEVLENGALRANSVCSQKALESIPTLDAFTSDFLSKMSDEYYFLSDFYTMIPTDEKETLSEQKAVDYLKEAIKVDSDKELKAP